MYQVEVVLVSLLARASHVRDRYRNRADLILHDASARCTVD